MVCEAVKGYRRGQRYPDRIFRAPALAGKQVSRPENQLGGGRRALRNSCRKRLSKWDCGIRSIRCRRSRRRQDFLRKLHNQFGNLGLAAARIMWAAAGSRSGFRGAARCLRKRALTSRSSPAIRPKPGLTRRTPSTCRPICRGKRRAKPWRNVAADQTAAENVDLRLPPARCCARRKLMKPRAGRTRPSGNCALQTRRPTCRSTARRQMPAVLLAERWRASRGSNPPCVSRRTSPGPDEIVEAGAGIVCC